MKLANEKTDLATNGKTLESIVQARATVFENNQKRKIDISDRNTPEVSVQIDNLRANPRKKGFFQNRLVLERQVKYVRKTHPGSNLPSARLSETSLKSHLKA